MCCFNHPVADVSATRIFVGARGGRQVTIYQASIQAQANSRIEMVLPVRSFGLPLEWLNLKSYETFFDDCRNAVEPPSRSYSFGAVKVPAAGALEVVQVGNYKVSYAPTLAALHRVDPNVFDFRLSPRLAAVFQRHYRDAEFGYVIFKPDKGGEMHPLGYRHPLRDDSPLFVPTLHEHGDGGAPHWDHLIYHQEDVRGWRATRRSVGASPCGDVFRDAQKKGLPVPAELDLSRPLQVLVRRGNFPNQDIVLRRAGQNPPNRFGAATGGGVVALGLGALWWLRTRRGRAARDD